MAPRNAASEPGELSMRKSPFGLSASYQTRARRRGKCLTSRPSALEIQAALSPPSSLAPVSAIIIGRSVSLARRS